MKITKLKTIEIKSDSLEDVLFTLKQHGCFASIEVINSKDNENDYKITFYLKEI